MWCSYYSDGGSNRIMCMGRWRPSNAKDALRDATGQCIPGCGPEWCTSPKPLFDCHAGCAWGPHQLKQMMSQQEAVDHRWSCGVHPPHPVPCQQPFPRRPLMLTVCSLSAIVTVRDHALESRLAWRQRTTNLCYTAWRKACPMQWRASS